MLPAPGSLGRVPSLSEPQRPTRSTYNPLVAFWRRSEKRTGVSRPRMRILTQGSHKRRVIDAANGSVTRTSPSRWLPGLERSPSSVGSVTSNPRASLSPGQVSDLWSQGHCRCLVRVTSSWPSRCSGQRSSCCPRKSQSSILKTQIGSSYSYVHRPSTANLRTQASNLAGLVSAQDGQPRVGRNPESQRSPGSLVEVPPAWPVSSPQSDVCCEQARIRSASCFLPAPASHRAASGVYPVPGTRPQAPQPATARPDRRSPVSPLPRRGWPSGSSI